MPRPSYFLIAAALLLSSACTSIPPVEQRRQQADELAYANSWQGLELQAGAFSLLTYLPQEPIEGDVLTLYLEGDGFAWINSEQPSSDPTPLDPLALRLALAQPGGNAAYLGRPCQYLGSERPPCRKSYWTGARFAEKVVIGLDQAIDQLKAHTGARRLVLIGYSGGGALALLLAARRNDVQRVVTVAGNLDHAAWTRHHRVTPLRDSLNPANLRPTLAGMEQLHLVGSADRVAPPELAQAFVAGYPAGTHADVRVMSGYDHRCCWAQHWAEIWQQN